MYCVHECDPPPDATCLLFTCFQKAAEKWVGTLTGVTLAPSKFNLSFNRYCLKKNMAVVRKSRVWGWGHLPPLPILRA